MDRKDENAYLITGSNEDLNKLYLIAKLLGEINDLKLKKFSHNGCPIIDNLTDKQKKILIAAKKSGYYDYPRKVTGVQLAKIVGLSKATVIEHLRKAEAKIIKSIINEIEFGIVEPNIMYH